jgi:hypothetical protein
MVSLETVIDVALALVLINAVLEVLVIVCWCRVERPQTPLLKLTTLCAAMSKVRSGVLLLGRYVYRFQRLEIRGHFRNRKQIVLTELQERTQEYV